MKYFTAAGILFLAIAAWFNTVTTFGSDKKEYVENLKLAEEYKERGLFVKSVSAYFAAYKYADETQQYDIQQNVIDCYEKLGDTKSFEDYCQQAIRKNPDKIESYQKLLKYYIKSEKTGKIIALLERAMKKFPDEKAFRDAYTDMEKKTEVSDLGYKSMTGWLDGYCVVQTDTKDDNGLLKNESRVLRSSGDTVVEEMFYNKLVLTDEPEQRFMVQGEDGRWKVINTSHYELENNLDVNFTDVGVLRDGFAWTTIKGKSDKEEYHLLNPAMGISKKEYQWAGTAEGGYMPVKTENKYGMLRVKDREIVTKKAYEDIKTDEFGRAYFNECFFGKTDGKYHVFDIEEKEKSGEVFDDAKPFVDTQPAAVKKGDKWGFLSKTGKMFLEPQYEDACSFSNGYAAVKKDGKWGYINKDNEMVVSPQFEEAKDFTKEGTAPVKLDSGYWGLIWMPTLVYSSEDE